MVSRAAGDDVNLIEGIEVIRIPLELVHDDGLAVFRDALAHRVADSLRLLVDLLEHEVLVAALLGSFCIPVDLKDLLRHGLTAAIRDLDGILRDDGELAVVEDVRAARACDDGGDIRCDEVLALTDADDERVVLLCADELVRLSLAHEDERIRTFDAVQHFADRGNEITVVDLFEQMGDNFRIRLRLEDMALLDELFFQAEIVLDDAVVHDDKVARAIRMRMRIAVRRTAVRCPARMADTNRALRHVILDLVAQRREAADALLDADAIAVIDSDAGRIVAAVLKLRESLEQKVRSLLVTDITYNTTHDTYLLVVLQQDPSDCLCHEDYSSSFSRPYRLGRPEGIR